MKIMKQFNLYIYRLLPFLAILWLSSFIICLYNYMDVDGLYNITYNCFSLYYLIKGYFIKFLIKIYMLILNIFFFPINIGLKIINFLYVIIYFIFYFIFYLIYILIMIIYNLIPSLRFIISYILDYIVFFVDLITHHYGFLWGDLMFKNTYNHEVYGKLILFVCDGITSLIVYVLYSLYILAASIFFLYNFIMGYVLIFHELLTFPILSYPFRHLVAPFMKIYEIYTEEPIFFKFIILYGVPGIVRFLRHEWIDYRIHFEMNAELYATENPDDWDVMSRYMDDSRTYRNYIIFYYFSFKFIIFCINLFMFKLGLYKSVIVSVAVCWIFFFIILFNIIINYFFWRLIKKISLFLYSKIKDYGPEIKEKINIFLITPRFL